MGWWVFVRTSHSQTATPLLAQVREDAKVGGKVGQGRLETQGAGREHRGEGKEGSRLGQVRDADARLGNVWREFLSLAILR